MYNRYIPQPDGSFRRSQVNDRRETPQQPPIQEHCAAARINDEAPLTPVRAPQTHKCRQITPQRKKENCRREEPQATGITTFLRNILPKDFDTGDLIVVLLLLLICADCTEDQNTAILTLALYLFL